MNGQNNLPALEQCSECDAFRPEPKGKIGTCRCAPKQAIVVQYTQSQTIQGPALVATGINSCYPPVEPTDWCRLFQRRSGPVDLNVDLSMLRGPKQDNEAALTLPDLPEVH